MIQNLTQLVQILRGRNPQEMVMSMVKNQKISDPNITQLIKFAESGDMDNLVNLANSICSQRGLDFNSEFQNFMSMMK